MRAQFSVGSISGNVSQLFPLAISSNSRYFVTPSGSAFFLMLDAAWAAIGQLSTSQIDTYLADRCSRGFTGTVVQLTNMVNSSQIPTYLNQNGDSPFSTITASTSAPFDALTCDFSSAGGAYWGLVDYYIQKSYALGMVAVAFPAYVGFPTTPREGWIDCVTGDSAVHLQNFGVFLANRYGSYGNIIWGLSGDNTLSTADMIQDWNIATGMRSVRTDLLIYAKAQRNISGYSMLSSDGGVTDYPGFNVNNVYVSNISSVGYTYATDCAAEYARSPVYPFFCDENHYELKSGITDNDLRRGLWGPVTSGSCGASFGNEALWSFGGENNPPYPSGGPTSVLNATYLDTNGAHFSTYLAALFNAYPWQKLVPQIGTTLVTTSLGSGAATICPALASDGTFAFIYTGSGNGFTVALSVFSISSIQARWYDPSNGTFAAASGSPFANSGTHAFTIPGANSGGDSDWVLVLG